MRLVVRFIKAITCWLVGGCKVSLTASERMEICKKCPHHSRGVCEICGCVLKMKTKMDTEQCPIDKW